MSTMAETQAKARRVRRRFTDEFKQQAVRLARRSRSAPRRRSRSPDDDSGVGDDGPGRVGDGAGNLRSRRVPDAHQSQQEEDRSDSHERLSVEEFTHLLQRAGAGGAGTYQGRAGSGICSDARN